jgi:hypothetical protein
MKIKKTAITIITSVLLMIFVSCDDINPFFAGGVVPGGNWIYFSDGSEIKKMRLDGSELESVFSVGYNSISRIQLDPFEQKIYILNFITNSVNQIYEYNLDGTAGKLIANTSTTNIRDMQIDSLNSKLYYSTDGGIWEIDLETGTPEDIYTGALGPSTSLCPDFQGNLYYTYAATFNKLNISTKTVSTDLVPALTTPSGISYDHKNVNFYLYDSININRISGLSSTWLYGSVAYVYAKNTEISTTEDKLFFVRDFAAIYAIYSIDLDGSGENKLTSDLPAFGGFDILSK